MALTIDLLALGIALRVGLTTQDVRDSPHRDQMARLHRVTEFTIDQYAAEAPADVQNEAAILMAGYIFEAPPFSRAPHSAFVHSGAKALLAPWHSIVSATVGGAAVQQAEAEPELPPAPEVRYVGLTVDELIDSSDFDAGEAHTIESNEADLTIPDGEGSQYIWGATPLDHIPSSVGIIYNGSQIGGLVRRDDFVYNGISYAIYRSNQALNIPFFSGAGSTVRFNA